MQTNKQEVHETSAAHKDVGVSLRIEQKDPDRKSWLRRLGPDIFSKTPKEKTSRNFFKAYAYRIYTSAWVTPLITVATLSAKSHYNLTIAKTAFLQGGIEFVVKPFTYALFEWGAAHITLGYRNNNAKGKSVGL